jgi:S-DNA-T family DNA segregation ATPase FtsK/SpoIIIE
MIDPKVVELSTYNGVPHLLIPVVTDPRKAAGALGWAVQEMANRYKLFADNNVRNIESYNKLMNKKENGEKLPQIVIIIDELADLMMVAPNDVEDAICRLAQMARAAGMHLVIATQRPSVDVITGVIKANIPSRISFAVSSQIDSRTILDMSGAEKLLGKGDMLFLPIGENKPIRIQGAFISEKEVEEVVKFLKGSANADYSNEIIDEIENNTPSPQKGNDEVDELLSEAINIAVDYGQVSASMLQRRLRIGFNRASRLVEEMELRGIVGPQDGSKPRQILISKEELGDNI